MIFQRIKTPGIAHVAYLIGNKGQAAVVDPRRDVNEYVTLARKHKLTIKYSIETHRQEDFVMGSAELASQCGAKIINGRHRTFGHGDIRLDDGEEFELAKGIRIVALHTPGHTPESMCYAVYLDDAPDHAWAVFTGDTLFIGEAGRTDLTDPSQTAKHAGQLYDAVHSKLLPLGDQTILLPAPATCTGAPGELYELSVKTLAVLDEVKLCTRKGSVLLIVNGASHCGQTYQYEPLQALYAKYKAQKFEVLAFPSKSFDQEKSTDQEVRTFCTDQYKITFPLFTIGPVVDDDAKGEKAQPVYQWLRKQPGMEAPVPWNFEKFLISRDGKAVKRFAYTMNPDPAVDPTIENAIKEELAKPCSREPGEQFTPLWWSCSRARSSRRDAGRAR